MNKTKARFSYYILTIVVISALLALAGCSKKSASTTTSVTTSKSSTTTVATSVTTTNETSTQVSQYSINSTSKTGIGTYLVDSKGLTLYWTSLDIVGQSNISGTTLANWPVFYVANITVSPSLNVSDFGTITRTDGSKQTTFKGWPLYYYIGDKAAGNTFGQGLAGVWFAVNPALSAPPALTTTASTTTTTTTTSPATTSSTTTPYTPPPYNY